jgi:hypothetical protein
MCEVNEMLTKHVCVLFKMNTVLEENDDCERVVHRSKSS